MHTSAPSLVQAISMRKCFNRKSLLRGAHTLTWPQKEHAKLYPSLITFYPICIPTIWPSFLPPWHVFVWITSVYSWQITSQTAFTSAPFWRRISTTSLHPSCADTCRGVGRSYGIQHCQQMQTHKRGWSENKCWTISVYCPPFSHSRRCRHSIDCVKA